jgi:hypothetical protein
LSLSGLGLAEGPPQRLQVRPADREDGVHRRLELHLPVRLGVPPADLEDVPDVHGVVAVHTDDAEGSEERHDLADRARVHDARRGPQPDQGRLPGGLEVVDVRGIDHPPAVASQVQEEPYGRESHGVFSHEL